MQQHHQPLPLGVGLGAPRAIGGQLPQALELLLIALVNQNLRLMAAVEQQRLEQQQQRQTMGAGMETKDWDLKLPPSTSNPPLAHRLPPTADPPATSLLSTSTAPSNFTATATATASNSVSSNSSQSKRASVAHSQQTPTPPGFASAEQYQRVSDHPFIPGNLDWTVVQGEDIDTEAGKTVQDFTVYGFGTGWGLATPVEEVPPPVPPSPTSLAVSNARAQPPTHTRTLIDTRPSTALSDYWAGDDEGRKRERPHSSLAELRRGEELVLGGLAEEG
ncbi:hypothetical protein FRC01_000140 [Tulasnella sp. 417]|nr:hypothetical protein FRC01_000140 [Tulasnella sp. 417]